MATSKIVKQIAWIGKEAGKKYLLDDYSSNITQLVDDVKKIHSTLHQGKEKVSDVVNDIKANGGKRISDWFYDRSGATDEWDLTDNNDSDFDAGYQIGDDNSTSSEEETTSKVLDQDGMKDIARGQVNAMYQIGAKQAEVSMISAAEISSNLNDGVSKMVTAINAVNTSLNAISEKMDLVTKAVVSKVEQEEEYRAEQANGIVGSNGRITLGSWFEHMKNQASSGISNASQMLQLFASSPVELVSTVLGMTSLKESGKFGDALSKGVAGIGSVFGVNENDEDKFINKLAARLKGQSIDSIGNDINASVGNIQHNFFGDIAMPKKLEELLSKGGIFGSLISDMLKSSSGIKRRSLSEGWESESQYTKDAAKFDGIVRTSIVEIIPDYLKIIAGALTGKTYGISMKGHVKEYKDGERENEIRNMHNISAYQGSAFGRDISNRMNKAFQSKDDDNASLKKMKEKINKDQADADDLFTTLAAWYFQDINPKVVIDKDLKSDEFWSYITKEFKNWTSPNAREKRQLDWDENISDYYLKIAKMEMLDDDKKHRGITGQNNALSKMRDEINRRTKEGWQDNEDVKNQLESRGMGRQHQVTTLDMIMGIKSEHKEEYDQQRALDKERHDLREKISEQEKAKGWKGKGEQFEAHVNELFEKALDEPGENGGLSLNQRQRAHDKRYSETDIQQENRVEGKSSLFSHITGIMPEKKNRDGSIATQDTAALFHSQLFSRMDQIITLLGGTPPQSQQPPEPAEPPEVPPPEIMEETGSGNILPMPRSIFNVFGGDGTSTLSSKQREKFLTEVLSKAKLPIGEMDSTSGVFESFDSEELTPERLQKLGGKQLFGGVQDLAMIAKRHATMLGKMTDDTFFETMEELESEIMSLQKKRLLKELNILKKKEAEDEAYDSKIKAIQRRREARNKHYEEEEKRRKEEEAEQAKTWEEWRKQKQEEKEEKKRQKEEAEQSKPQTYEEAKEQYQNKRSNTESEEGASPEETEALVGTMNAIGQSAINNDSQISDAEMTQIRRLGMLIKNSKVGKALTGAWQFTKNAAKNTIASIKDNARIAETEAEKKHNNPIAKLIFGKAAAAGAVLKGVLKTAAKVFVSAFMGPLKLLLTKVVVPLITKGLKSGAKDVGSGVTGLISGAMSPGKAIATIALGVTKIVGTLLVASAAGKAMINYVKNVFKVGLNALKKPTELLVKTGMPLIKQLGNVVVKSLKSIGNFISSISSSVNALADVFGEFATQFFALLEPLGTAIGSIVGAIVGILPATMSLINMVAIPALKAISWVLDKAIVPIIEGLGGTVEYLAGRATEFFGNIEVAIGELLSFFKIKKGDELQQKGQALIDRGSDLASTGAEKVESLINGTSNESSDNESEDTDESPITVTPSIPSVPESNGASMETVGSGDTPPVQSEDMGDSVYREMIKQSATTAKFMKSIAKVVVGKFGPFIEEIDKKVYEPMMEALVENVKETKETKNDVLIPLTSKVRSSIAPNLEENLNINKMTLGALQFGVGEILAGIGLELIASGQADAGNALFQTSAGIAANGMVITSEGSQSQANSISKRLTGKYFYMSSLYPEAATDTGNATSQISDQTTTEESNDRSANDKSTTDTSSQVINDTPTSSASNVPAVNTNSSGYREYAANGLYGSGNSQGSYGSYLNMSQRGCGPIALADAANRRGGHVSARALAGHMASSGNYSTSRGTSVGGFLNTASSMGMGYQVGGVTNASLKRATPNNPITLVGSGTGFGTNKGNTHYVNVVGSSGGTSLVSNPLTGRVERRSTGDLISGSVVGLYGSGDVPAISTGLFDIYGSGDISYNDLTQEQRDAWYKYATKSVALGGLGLSGTQIVKWFDISGPDWYEKNYGRNSLRSQAANAWNNLKAAWNQDVANGEKLYDITHSNEDNHYTGQWDQDTVKAEMKKENITWQTMAGRLKQAQPNLYTGSYSNYLNTESNVYTSASQQLNGVNPINKKYPHSSSGFRSWWTDLCNKYNKSSSTTSTSATSARATTQWETFEITKGVVQDWISTIKTRYPDFYQELMEAYSYACQDGTASPTAGLAEWLRAKLPKTRTASSKSDIPSDVLKQIVGAELNKHGKKQTAADIDNDLVNKMDDGSSFDTTTGNYGYYDATSGSFTYTSNPGGATGYISTDKKYMPESAGVSTPSATGKGSSALSGFKQVMSALAGTFGKILNFFSLTNEEEKVSQLEIEEEKEKENKLRNQIGNEQYDAYEDIAFQLYMNENPKNQGESDDAYQTRMKNGWTEHIRRKWMNKAASENVTMIEAMKYNTMVDAQEGAGSTTYGGYNNETGTWQGGILNGTTTSTNNISSYDKTYEGKFVSDGGAIMFMDYTPEITETNITEDGGKSQSKSPVHEFFRKTSNAETEYVFSKNGNWYTKRDTPDTTGEGSTGDKHTGVDILAYPKSIMTSGKADLRAITGGTITDVRYAGKGNPESPYNTVDDGGWGNSVEFMDTAGYRHRYAHMRNNPTVKIGDAIDGGVSLGVIGNTGDSHGEHVHYEIKSPEDEHINPLTYFKLYSASPQNESSYEYQSEEKIDESRIGEGSGGTTAYEQYSDQAYNKKVIWKYLTETMGFTKEGTAGVMGNLKAESGFYPMAVYLASRGGKDHSAPDSTNLEVTQTIDNATSWPIGKNDPYGIAQWLGDRSVNLMKFSKEKGTSIADLPMQLDFMRSELESSEKNAMIVKDATNVVGAATDWMNKFERCNGQASSQRKRYAQEVYDEFKNWDGSGVTIPNGTSVTSSYLPASNGTMNPGMNIGKTPTALNWNMSDLGFTGISRNSMGNGFSFSNFAAGSIGGMYNYVPSSGLATSTSGTGGGLNPGTWINTLNKTVKATDEAGLHTYHMGGNTTIELGGKTIHGRPDCTGLIQFPLDYLGYDIGNVQSNALVSAASNSKNPIKKDGTNSPDFEALKWGSEVNASTVQPGDIVVRNGHGEIAYGMVDGSFKGWNFGHDDAIVATQGAAKSMLSGTDMATAAKSLPTLEYNGSDSAYAYVIRPVASSLMSTGTLPGGPGINVRGITRTAAPAASSVPGYTNSGLAQDMHTSVANYHYTRPNGIKKVTWHTWAGSSDDLSSLENTFKGRTDAKVSVNYGITNDGKIGRWIDEGLGSFTSSSKTNDEQAVTLEISNAPGEYQRWKQNGDETWAISDAALQSAINLTVDVAKRNNIPGFSYTATGDGYNGDGTDGTWTYHRMFKKKGEKSCPGNYIFDRTNDILNVVNSAIAGSGDVSSIDIPEIDESKVSQYVSNKTYPSDIVPTNGSTDTMAWGYYDNETGTWKTPDETAPVITNNHIIIQKSDENQDIIMERVLNHTYNVRAVQVEELLTQIIDKMDRITDSKKTTTVPTGSNHNGSLFPNNDIPTSIQRLAKG